MLCHPNVIIISGRRRRWRTGRGWSSTLLEFRHHRPLSVKPARLLSSESYAINRPMPLLRVSPSSWLRAQAIIALSSDANFRIQRLAPNSTTNEVGYLLANIRHHDATQRGTQGRVGGMRLLESRVRLNFVF
jgi:hypothetical protein